MPRQLGRTLSPLVIGTVGVVATLYRIAQLSAARSKLQAATGSPHTSVAPGLSAVDAFGYLTGRVRSAGPVMTQPGLSTPARPSGRLLPPPATAVLIDGDVDAGGRTVVATGVCRPHRGERAFTRVQDKFEFLAGDRTVLKRTLLQIDVPRIAQDSYVEDAVTEGFATLDAEVSGKVWGRTFLGFVSLLMVGIMIFGIYMFFRGAIEMQIPYLRDLRGAFWPLMCLGLVLCGAAGIFTASYLQQRNTYLIDRAADELSKSPASVAAGLVWYFQRPVTTKPRLELSITDRAYWCVLCCVACICSSGNSAGIDDFDGPEIERGTFDWVRF
ncbi:hypothetical protein H9P43_006406 [Blastocladiella emersonii ATCC 22665]|nr:hypothetical protein H9P43_006406 [Blastocladiella emersonii ATCC 22665]